MRPLTTPARRATAPVAALSLCLAAAACGGDGPSAPRAADVAGVYSLVEVRGQALPSAVFQGPWTFDDGTSVQRLTITATAGAIALTRDGKVLDWEDFDFDADGVTWSDRPVILGTYAVRGDSLTLDEGPGLTFAATVRNGTLRVTEDMQGTKIEQVYRR